MLEDDDFEREVQLFLDEVEIQEIADTCTFEEYATAGSHTLVDGPGLRLPKNGLEWQLARMGLCEMVFATASLPRLLIFDALDRRGLGAEGDIQRSKITIQSSG